MENKKKPLTRDLLSDVYRAGQDAAMRIEQRAIKAERARLRAAVEAMKAKHRVNRDFPDWEALEYEYNEACDDVLQLLTDEEGSQGTEEKDNG